MKDSSIFSVRKYGKINLFLKVFPVEPNGYHRLFTIFQPVDLYDDIFLKKVSQADHVVEYSGRVSGVNIFGDKDLCLRAVNVFLDKYVAEVDNGCVDKFHISVYKNIPVQGGMAGGSVDAAGVLCLLNDYYSSPFSVEELEEMAALLGADVPFGVRNVLCVGDRYGDKVEPIVSDALDESLVDSFSWLLLINKQGLSTPEVFAEFDNQIACLEREGLRMSDNVKAQSGVCFDSDSVGFRESFVADFLSVYSNVYGLGGFIFNDLESAALKLRKDLREIISCANDLGVVKSFISGSGPTCVLLCESSRVESVKEQLLACSVVEKYVDEILVVKNK